MKIKTADLSYDAVLALPAAQRPKPKRPSLLFRTLLKALSLPDLRATRFRCHRIGMERLHKDEPCLVLMNHSSFIDLKIASSVLYPRPFNIVCTVDGFVGKQWLMRNLGCIPTTKFISDPQLVHDMLYTIKTLRSSILMYPEASYSFDGTATPLPDSLGRCLKLLGVPVVMIRTYGAFTRDPLYNGLQLRRVDVSADMEYLLSPEDIASYSAQTLNDILRQQFNFDHFRWQQEHHVRVNEPFRADGLNRVLYKCRHCLTEGEMSGHGTQLTCKHCGKVWTLTEYGQLETNGEISHIPDWYRWERDCVRQELAERSYKLDVPVEICMMVDTSCVYRVGNGRLRHTPEGFHLTGCDGKLDYRQSPMASYSLYADYFWYELGDMICIGTNKIQYYCFPTGGDVAAKTRLATEELYKLVHAGRSAIR